MKRLLASWLVVALLLSFAACGGETKVDSGTDTETTTIDNTDGGDKSDIPLDITGQKGFSFADEEYSVTLGTPAKTLDPQAIYDSLTYTPQMFYGSYGLEGGEDAVDEFGKTASYAPLTIDGDTLDYSVLPVAIDAGKHNLTSYLSEATEYDWMRLTYMADYSGEKYSTYLYCAYSIEGNKLILKPLNDWDYDEEALKISYEFSDEVIEYTFEFCGLNLTLSSGEDSITLRTGLEPFGEYAWISVDHYPSVGSDSIDGIDEFAICYDGSDGFTFISMEMEDGELSYESNAFMNENGLLTLTLALENSIKTYQFVYFYCYWDGIVLTDGTNTYYYNDSYSDRHKDDLNDYITEDMTGQLEDLTDEELETIIEKKDSLFEDLTIAFTEAGISVTINENTGELAIDSAVLFGGDSAELSDKGKDFLDKFVKTYVAIVYSDLYNGFIAKTIVEGHTAPISGSTYESGLPLSEKRANNVKDYCLSGEAGVDITALAETMEAVGYSNSRPIKDADGNVDMAASRRVSFRFIINLS